MERQSRGFQVFIYAAALLLAVVVLAPFIWLLIMSVSSTKDLTTIPLALDPERFDFSRYGQLLTLAENSAGRAFLFSLRNSIAVASIATLCAICVGIPAAWAVSRAERRLDLALYAVVATCMLPPSRSLCRCIWG